MQGRFPSLRPAPTPEGFSLVEVVVLLTLLGMASAFALPRFTSLANRTRASEVQALGADLREATQVAHAEFMASGSTLATVRFKGKTLSLKNGYPEANANGIGKAVVDWAGFTAKTHTNPSVVTFFKIGAPVDAQCSVTYQASPSPSVAAAVVDINVSGC